ncbi:MAG: TonB-dependent receptor [Parasphingopyxis sp.]|uniref:TonB-dependent receptor n=1 Tax=Parasphingopyxis sp. TaxID=1920299 RepID=UPI0032EDAED6
MTMTGYRAATPSLVAVAALLCANATGAQAQDISANNSSTQSAGTETAGGTPIIVTAQKREESLQDIPLAVTAIGGDSLEQRGVSDIAGLAADVPGLDVSEQIGQARITLRGIGVDNISTGAESSVAFNQDGVYFSRSSAALASFYDINRVEVLRGPQGTLYGRNATGGSVNVITNRPTFDFAAGFNLTLGNHETINADAYISDGFSDAAAWRLSAQVQNHDGYGQNITTGTDIDTRHSQAIRGQILLEPSDAVEVLLGADYFHSDDRANTYHYFGPAGQTATGMLITPTAILLGGAVPRSERDIASVQDPSSTAEFWGLRADVSVDVSDTVTLRSITAFRNSEYSLHTDINPLGVDLFPLDLSERSEQFTEELQLNWTTDNNTLVAGVFYLNERIDGELAAPFNLIALGGPDFFVQGFFSGGRLNTDAFAVFAQDTFSFTDTLRLTVGARYSWERKQVADQSDFDFARPFSPANRPLTPVNRDSTTFESFTPRIGLEFDLTPDVLLYATFSQGFKAGTYNLGSAGPVLNPEEVDAWEAGLKASGLNGRLRANIAGFYYDYTDLQVGTVQGQLLVLENAASAEIYGLEGEFMIEPVDNLIFALNASWLHARFTDYVTADQARPGGDGVTIDENGLPAFDLAGNALPQAPDYTIDLSVQYTFDVPGGELTLRGESYWSDRVYFSAYNRDVVSQEPYDLQNAFVTYASDDGWRLTGFIRNIANDTIRSAGQVATVLLGSPVVGFVRPPRTFGVIFGVDF